MIVPLGPSVDWQFAAFLEAQSDLGTKWTPRYIRISAFDSSHGWESVRLSFIVNRPKEEPGFRLDRQESIGRNIRYATRAYAADRPEGERYPN